MRITRAILIGLLLISACRRNEPAATAPAQATATDSAPNVQDLSNADTEMTIVPVRPVFVKNVDVLTNGTSSGDGDVEAKKADRIELVVSLQQAPRGLGIRYELRDAARKVVGQERQMPAPGATETRFTLKTNDLEPGAYTLLVWSGGDLVGRRGVRIVDES